MLSGRKERKARFRTIQQTLPDAIKAQSVPCCAPRVARGRNHHHEMLTSAEREAFAHGAGSSMLEVCAVVCVPYVAMFGLWPAAQRALGSACWSVPRQAALELVTVVLPACAACVCAARHLVPLYLLLLLPLALVDGLRAGVGDHAAALCRLNEGHASQSLRSAARCPFPS